MTSASNLIIPFNETCAIITRTAFQETAKKKAAAEKIKRRNYEIRVLKGELTKKSQDLNQSKRRLMTLENSNVSIQIN